MKYPNRMEIGIWSRCSALKVPAQDDELDQDQQKAEGDRELAQRKRKVQAEHIGDR